DRAAHTRRRGANAWRGRRIPRGVSGRRDDVLWRAGRGGGGRGDRAASLLDRTGAAARALLRGPGRSEHGQHAAACQRVGAGETCMKCPYCSHLGDKVVDSRESKEGEAIRRRRECLECGKRFTSYERIDEIPYM